MRTRRFTAALAALALAIGWGGLAARAADLPTIAGDKWQVGPKPNDEGYRLIVEWDAQPAETAYVDAIEEQAANKRAGRPNDKPLPAMPTYEYVVRVTGAPNGEFREVAKVAAIVGWQSDAADIYGNGAADRKGKHYAVVNILSVVTPKVLAAAAFAAMVPESARPEAAKQKIAGIVSLLGDDAIQAAKAVLERQQVRNAEELTDVAMVGYFGTGGLMHVILDRDWRVQIVAREPGSPAESPKAEKTARTLGARWHALRMNNFLIMVVFTAVILISIQAARKNPNMFLRRIGGLDAVDEALGRATEMGKPVLFVHGLDSLSSISTIAAVNILGEIAKKVARYDSKLLCVNNDPVVLAVSQETVKEGYMNAGRPDGYNQDDVFFVAAEQFSYVAAVDGIMVRQKPAANFYCGYFYAESLLLSETGATTGAIQIAATDAYTQLPFFVTTCDYTLMGEELYAASAYLSRDPMLLGSLKGQDIGKAIMVAAILLGTGLETFGVHFLTLLLKAY